MSQIEPDFVSKTSFYWLYQDNLQIMSDQKTIIGAEYNEEKKHSQIVIEDITNQDEEYSPVKINQHKNQIWNILIDEDNNSLYVGDYNGRMVEYSLSLKHNYGEIIKDYEDLGVGIITSSVNLGQTIVFAGYGGRLGFIDTQKRELLENKIQMAPRYIKSMELCWVENQQSQLKALLTVNGWFYDYSSKTDVLDVTGLSLIHI